MPRLTLRTLLAYIDDTLEPDQARALGRKVAASDEAKQLIERIKRVTRRRGLRTPVPDGSADDVADPNTVAAYLSDNLDSDQLKQIETTCLESDVHLAEVAACHQILTLVLTEPVRVPPTANQRMYGLVPAPESDPMRKPGKAIPVGGISPPGLDAAEADDTDAALLLGMRRYAATDSWVGRLKLVAVVGGISLFLILAIFMALPHSDGDSPETARSANYAQVPTPTSPTADTPPTLPVAAAPSTASTAVPVPVAVTPKTDTETKPETKTESKEVSPPKGDPLPGLGDKKVSPPSPGRGLVGKMERAKVIVLTRAPEPKSRWLRVDPDEPNVNASDMVMALPGYKAEVKLSTGIVARLWGNLPEQVSSPKTRVMQSRVRFHTPPAGFEADITLEQGRIYLTSNKPGPTKVRVRITSEVWDLELPNDKVEILLQAHTAFVPGTPYPFGGVGGEPPRTEALLVVVRGTASIEVPNRYKKFPTVPTGTEISWDSKTNNLVPPLMVNKQEVAPDPDPLMTGEIGIPIQRVLSDLADNLKDRAGIRPLLESRMDYEKVERFDLPRRIATYCYGAILDGMDGDEARIMVGNLYDMMVDSERMIVRQAAITATSAWLPRAPQNTALLVSVLTTNKLLPPDDANLIARLLRGYSAATFGPSAGDVTKLSDLLTFLNSDLIVVREAALGNLITYYDLPAVTAGAVKGYPPLANVGTKFSGYEQFLKDWVARTEEIKNWMTMKKVEKSDRK
jgi:hypothetical protein